MKIPVSRWWGRGPRVCFALVLALCAADCSSTPSSPDLGIDAAPSGPLRSALYPATWDPSFTDASGRFLHDFSYAGYHNGAAPLPQPLPGKTFDIAGFGADATGQADATTAIQKAIDAVAAAGGGVVALGPGEFRVDGVLEVKTARTVIAGAGPDKTRLRFTKVKGMSDRAHLTFRGAVKPAAPLPLVEDGKDRALTVAVADASSLKPGDDVSIGWTITPAFVEAHGMTGVWTVFLNQWKPVFRRQVVKVDTAARPHRVTVDVPLRYDALLRDGAALRPETGYLAECGLQDLSLTSAVAWADAWVEMRNHAVDLIDTADCWIRNVRSYASSDPAARGHHLQSGGLRVLSSKRATVADVQFQKAQNRGEGGCGYLFEISMSSEVLVRDSSGVDGRHNFIQNWDFGTTGCVWLRIYSQGGHSYSNINDATGIPAFCEYHHSLAMANLVDQSQLRDGWYGGNRGLDSSGAGITATENAYWNLRGPGGIITSFAWGWGYVIGTEDLFVFTDPKLPYGTGTAPEDLVEGRDEASTLDPPSLYEDQLKRRLGK